MFTILKTSLRRIVILSAIAYPIALLSLWIVLALLGQDWWVAVAALYLPSLIYAVPLPLLVGALLAFRQKRLLWLQLAAGLILLFPLMGFVLPWPTWAKSDRPTLRILSYNVLSGVGGYETLAREIEAEAPSIVVLQEILSGGDRIFSLLRSRYAFVEGSTQFMVGSRHPIVSQTEPARVAHEGRERSPRFVRYLIATPLGRIAVYNVHPVSPTEGIHRLRGSGFRREILSGRLLRGENSQQLMSDARLRELQVRALAESAGREVDPVVIAGDTNLPSLSPLLRRHLSNFNDGFGAAGWGLGYTFPRDPAWLRLDRILASDRLKCVGFTTGRGLSSDHRYVVADLQLRDR